MVTKKLFALASVTALTGVIAVSMASSGCSSTTVEAGGGDSAVAAEGGAKIGAACTTGAQCASGKCTAGKCAVATSGGDAEPEDAAVDDTCKGKVAVDVTMLPWKSPNVSLGACTKKMLSDLVAYVDANQTAKYADWKKTVTDPTCSACIFGKESETKWKPLLEDASGTLIELNVGGCIGIATNNANCGKAYQNWFDCRFEACSDCAAGNSAALQKCLSDASKAGKACNAAFTNVDTVCTTNGISDAETKCNGVKYVFEGPIKAQCISAL